jgi:DNA-directed RNA polymerase specialized sigma24 family protein
MSESTTPTHILLRQMRSTDDRARDHAFETLVYRFRGPFEHYGRKKLGDDDAPLATDDTFVKIYTSRRAYNETKCACKQECMCTEARAHKYLWRIHENTVIDWLRQQMRKKHYVSVPPEEIPEEMWLDVQTPEEYVVARIRQEIILRAWERLSEADRQLLTYRPGPGRPNPALQRARCEAWGRFRTILAIALAEEE